jgi:hypothetical protein
MKRISYLAIVLLVVFSACESKDKATKETSEKAKDSSTTSLPDSLPPISNEFNQPVKAKPGDSVFLGFNYRKGKSYLTGMDFNMVNNRNGKSTTNTMKWNYVMDVVDEKDHLKTIKTTYKKIEMAMEINGQKMDFSSEKTVDPLDFMQMPSRMFAIIKGKSFTMQVNEQGEIVSVSGFDKIGDEVVKEMNLPQEMKSMMQERFKQQFNDETVREMFSHSFNIFPNKFIKPGDSWEKKTRAGSASILNLSTIYTVKDIRNNKIYLDASGKLKGDEKHMSGTQTGKLIVDAKTGLVLEATFDQKSNGAFSSTSKGRITGKEL